MPWRYDDMTGPEKAVLNAVLIAVGAAVLWLWLKPLTQSFSTAHPAVVGQVAAIPQREPPYVVSPNDPFRMIYGHWPEPLLESIGEPRCRSYWIMAPGMFGERGMVSKADRSISMRAATYWFEERGNVVVIQAPPAGAQPGQFRDTMRYWIMDRDTLRSLDAEPRYAFMHRCP